MSSWIINRQHEKNVESIERIDQSLGLWNYSDYYYWSNRISICVRLYVVYYYRLSIVSNSTNYFISGYSSFELRVHCACMLLNWKTFDALRFIAMFCHNGKDNKRHHRLYRQNILSMEILNFTVFVYCIR